LPGFLRVLEKGKSGAVYNLGARNERHNVDVAESVLDALGKPRSLIRFVKDRPGHDRRYAIDPSRAESELAWRPLETWESGLQKTIDWYRENLRWIEELGAAPIETTTGSNTNGGRGKLKVLVTGAGGLVGRAVAKHCAAWEMRSSFIPTRP